MRYTKCGCHIALDSDVMLFAEFLGFDHRVVLGKCFGGFADYIAFYMRTFQISEAAALPLVHDDIAEAGEVHFNAVLGPRG